MAPMDLGKLGVWTTYRRIEEDQAGEAAALAEQLGYGTFWLGGSPRLPSVRPLLEATESIVVATSIVNIWTYAPAQLAAEYAELARDFRERLLVGIGVGHPEATSDDSRPFSAMQAFLDGVDAAQAPIPRERRCRAAPGAEDGRPERRALAGAIPYFTPVEHTRVVRAQLGAGPLVAPRSHSCSTPTSSAPAPRRAIRAALPRGEQLHEQPAQAGIQQQDIGGGGSDRLIEVIPHGTAEEIAVGAGASGGRRRPRRRAGTRRAGHTAPELDRDRARSAALAGSGSGPQCCAASEARLHASRPSMSIPSYDGAYGPRRRSAFSSWRVRPTALPRPSW